MSTTLPPDWLMKLIIKKYLEGVTLEWIEIPKQPYNTLEATTPFGKYRIEWKGWKDYDNCDIMYNDEYLSGWYSVEEAKEYALKDYKKKLTEALGGTNEDKTSS